jgi:hypothetical protein
LALKNHNAALVVIANLPDGSSHQLADHGDMLWRNLEGLAHTSVSNNRLRAAR